MSGLTPLMWSGFRAVHGKRSYGWAGVVIAVVGTALMWWLQAEPAGRFVFFALLLIAGAFAVLLGIELIFVPPVTLRLTAPAVAASAIVVLNVIWSIVAELALGGPPQLDFMHSLLSITVILYVIGMTASIVGLVSTWRAAPSTTGVADPVMTSSRFTELVTERLRRVRNRRERTWTFIDLRIDELRKIRAATGEVAVNTVAAHFERTIVSSFPADADIGRGESGQVLVLVSLPSISARESVRTILRQISDGYTSNPLAVRLTASAGMVAVDPDNADLAQLVAQARDAVEIARDNGGDRWHRVDAIDED